SICHALPARPRPISPARGDLVAGPGAAPSAHRVGDRRTRGEDVGPGRTLCVRWRADSALHQRLLLRLRPPRLVPHGPGQTTVICRPDRDRAGDYRITGNRQDPDGFEVDTTESGRGDPVGRGGR